MVGVNRVAAHGVCLVVGKEDVVSGLVLCGQHHKDFAHIVLGVLSVFLSGVTGAGGGGKLDSQGGVHVAVGVVAIVRCGSVAAT